MFWFSKISIIYNGILMPRGFSAGIVINGTVILEAKGMTCLTPTHEAQLRTYPRMNRIPIGRLVNFHALRLPGGVKPFAP